MQKKSWITLAACVGLIGFLVVAYVGSQSSPETLTQAQATQALDQMRDALVRKDVNSIMQHIAPGPDTRLAGLTPDQLRLMILRFFRATGEIRADCSNISFVGGKEDATMEFDLTVHNEGPNLDSLNYPNGHITLHLRRIDVPRLWGLFQGKEWRIVGAESSISPMNFGDY